VDNILLKLQLCESRKKTKSEEKQAKPSHSLDQQPKEERNKKKKWAFSSFTARPTFLPTIEEKGSKLLEKIEK